jgi:hypothetical protein
MAKFSSLMAMLVLPPIPAHAQLLLLGGRSDAKLDLYNADRTVLIAPMVNDMVIDLSKTPSLNIKASAKKPLQSLLVGSMSFFVDDKLLETDNDASYWLVGDKDRAWTPSIGKHLVTVRAHCRKQGRGRKILEASIRIVVTDSRTKEPAAAAPASAPVLAPVAGPVISPATFLAPTPASTPMTAPRVAPATVPFNAPASAPAIAPATSPVTAPVKGPIGSDPSFPVAPAVGPKQPTDVPIRAPIQPPTRLPMAAPTPIKPPTKSPTPAPTPCVSDLGITLSGQKLSLAGATPLEEALLQLVQSNSKVQLSTCNELDKYRIMQRFAYLALVYSTGKGDVEPPWFANADECTWTGVICNINKRFSTVDLSARELQGRIPADVGLWNNLRQFVVFANELKGPLPSTVGHWTSLTGIAVSSNALTGSLPSTITAWTSLRAVYMDRNKLTGSLPSSIGLWSKLTIFAAAQNQFAGSLPTDIGVWSDLGNFDVSLNQLTGTIPVQVSNWTSIQTVLLRGNSFSGAIPIIGTNFCPLNNVPAASELWAACREPARNTCGCCNFCCDADGRNCLKIIT